MKECTTVNTQNIDVSIIIVTYNNAKYITACIENIHEALDNLRAEILVIDNCSSDNCTEIALAASPLVKLIKNKKNVGFAAAVNQGLAASLADTLLLLNSDVLINKDALHALVAACQDAAKKLFSPTIVNVDGSFQETSLGLFPTFPVLLADELLPHRLAKALGLRTMFDNFNAQKTPCYEWLSGACLALHRRVYEKVGPFDEKFFMYFEDVDFCKRASERGIASQLCSDISVLHIGGASFAYINGIRDRNNYVTQSYFTYIKKHESPLVFFFFKLIVRMGRGLRLCNKLFQTFHAKYSSPK